jgi:hypothetical protein
MINKNSIYFGLLNHLQEFTIRKVTDKINYKEIHYKERITILFLVSYTPVAGLVSN